MGVMTPPGDDLSCLGATKPKERQFQVVPVPGVFTRGRWKCWDFRDDQLAGSDILEFGKPEDDDVAGDASTIIVTGVAPMNLQSSLELELPSEPISANGSMEEALTPQSAPPVIQQASLPATTSSSVPPSTVNLEELIPSFENEKADLTRQPSSATINIPVTLPTSDHDEDGIQPGTIDTKIEQAMDLVKGHLTMAVRGAMEDMRANINQLQNKIAMLQNENRLLRQYAPAHIVNDLPMLIQNNQIPLHHTAASMPSTEGLAEGPSSSRNISPAPSDVDDASSVSVPKSKAVPHPLARLPAMANVAMLDAFQGPRTPGTPPAGGYTNVYDPAYQIAMSAAEAIMGADVAKQSFSRQTSLHQPSNGSQNVLRQVSPPIQIPGMHGERHFSPPNSVAGYASQATSYDPQQPKSFSPPLVQAGSQNPELQRHMSPSPSHLQPSVQTIPVVMDPPTPQTSQKAPSNTG